MKYQHLYKATPGLDPITEALGNSTCSVLLKSTYSIERSWGCVHWRLGKLVLNSKIREAFSSRFHSLAHSYR